MRLQSIQSALENNTSNLREIDKRIKKIAKSLKRIEDNPIYSKEQRLLYQEMLENMTT